jgi:hypothetical protein
MNTNELRRRFEDHRGLEYGRPEAVVHVGTVGAISSESDALIGEIEFAVVAEREHPNGKLAVTYMFLIDNTVGLWQAICPCLMQWLVEYVEEIINNPDYGVQE